MTGRPLSPAQRAIWYEEQLQTSRSNTGFFSVTLHGAVPDEQIRRACAAIVGRHEPLRMVVVPGEEPTLVGLDAPIAYETVPVPCPPGEETAASRAWRERCGKRRFDLTREPGIAFSLLRHGPGRSTLLVVVHHICFDGRSKFIFAREFTSTLDALRRGQPPPLTPAPYPLWPDEDGQVCAQAARYWDGVDLADCAPLAVPRGEPAAPETDGTTGELIVDGATRAALAAIAAEHGTSLFGALLAGLAMHLYAYGNEQIVLSVPVDASTPQSRDLIGLAVNVVPVLLRVSGDATLITTIGAARDAIAHIRQFRRVPFRNLSAGRALAAGAPALFSQISLSYLHLPPSLPGMAGVELRWDFVAPNSARTFSLMLHLRDADDHLVLRLDYAGAILDRTAATAIVTHFAAVLRHVVREPSTPARAGGVLPRDSVLHAVAHVPAPRHPFPVLDLCADHAARDPDRPAIAGPDGMLRYRELEDAATTGGHAGRPWVAGEPMTVAGLAGLVRTACTPSLPHGLTVAALRWQAARLGRTGGDVRTVPLAPVGSPRFWQECLLTWAAGGLVVLPPGGAPPPGPAHLRALLVEHRATLWVTDYRPLRTVVDTPGLTLTDVLTPVGQVRPSTGVGALIRAGVRLHAQLVDDGAGIVAMWEGPVTGDGPPALRDLPPGVRLSIRAPDAGILPRGVPGWISLDVARAGEMVRHITGDRGWLDRSGALRHLGAAADTVHWGGSALHVPSLERHLAAQPDIEEAVVVMREHRPVAYLVPRAGRRIDVGEVRRHLRRRAVAGELRLAQVRVLDDGLPSTADGEVDRAALAAMDPRLPAPRAEVNR